MSELMGCLLFCQDGWMRGQINLQMDGYIFEWLNVLAVEMIVLINIWTDF